MTTLKTLLAYEKLHDIIEEFFYKKCTEYKKAEYPTWDRWTPGGEFDSFEILRNHVSVKYRYYSRDADSYSLPLDILFDDDFYDKIKARFDKKRQVEDERKREDELKLLEALKKKYGEE